MRRFTGKSDQITAGRALAGARRFSNRVRKATFAAPVWLIRCPVQKRAGGGSQHFDLSPDIRRLPMLKQMLLIGAAAVSFPELAQETPPAGDDMTTPGQPVPTDTTAKTTPADTGTIQTEPTQPTRAHTETNSEKKKERRDRNAAERVKRG